MFYELFNSKDNQTEQLFAKRNQTMGDFSGKKPPAQSYLRPRFLFSFSKDVLDLTQGPGIQQLPKEKKRNVVQT
jgi:hypothetical protein